MMDSTARTSNESYRLAVRAIPYTLILFLCAYWIRLADGDLFHLVASGRLTVRDGWPSRIDPFAYTVTKPVWVDHEWLSALIFYGVSQISGDLSLFMLTCMLGYLTILALLWAQNVYARTDSRCNPILFLSLFPCSFIWNSTIRPLTLSFFLFALLLALLEAYRRAGRRSLLCALPALFWIWGNAHGSFIVGLALLGITVVCQVVVQKGAGQGPLICAALASFVAAFVTPFGWDFVEFIMDAAVMARPLMSEWSATRFNLSNLIFYGVGALAFFVLGSGARGRIPLEVRVFLVISFIAAVRHQRHIPYFLFTASVYLLASAQELEANLGPFLRARAESASRVCSGLMLGAASLGAIQLGYFVLNMSAFKLDYSRQPVETVAWLSQNAEGGKILVHFNHGSYVLLHGYPRFKVSLDARYEEVYPNKTFEGGLQALEPGSEHFASAFEEARPDFILMCRDCSFLADWGRFSEDWRNVFTGDGGRCAVFVRDPNLVTGSARPNTSDNSWKLNF
jgi:hypothetical protein